MPLLSTALMATCGGINIIADTVNHKVIGCYVKCEMCHKGMLVSEDLQYVPPSISINDPKQETHQLQFQFLSDRVSDRASNSPFHV